MIQNLTDLSRKLDKGVLRSADLVQEALSRIAAPGGQGDVVFLRTYAGAAMAQAEWIDAARAKGLSLPRYAGVPLAIKDLFDVRGEVTRAGSRVLDEQPPAEADATIVQRLRAAGFVIVGKNNMTEFAYSGLGINAHFGTPRNPHDTSEHRIPGGSSSGAAVAVAEEMVPAAIGTDTGGSCRIPAAFCGVVGFKPTSTRVPKDGTVPLSTSLDCIGPFATSVSSCAVLDCVLSGGAGEDVASFPEGGLRLAVLEGYVTEHMDDQVGAAFQKMLSRLSARGVRLMPLTVGELAELPKINSKGGLVGAEAYSWHKPFLETRADFYDPWVRERFGAGQSQTADDYIRTLEARARMRSLFAERTEAFDAVILPAVQIVAPTLDSLKDPAKSAATNLLCLRNTAVGNFLDLPAITIPCQESGALPVGAMLMGRTGGDRHLLSIARGLEGTIRGQ
ncbi:amidase [Defluviimonas sp. WL0075]|uniref:Amidase n=1 Tax=Albidovulum sediminicola TaxID=2984331 RepID=A0ABT2Z5N9_9RHOB|nr:amidase [Defluviimonas sp. WL0075]MCV2866317.1 amidase [Defluviimonas sp. WL0075]